MAEEKKNSGLMDNDQTIDSIAEDLNNMLKYMTNQQYIHICAKVVDIVQKLSCLKEGFKAEKKSMEDQIKELQDLNNKLAEKAFENMKTGMMYDADGNEYKIGEPAKNTETKET